MMTAVILHLFVEWSKGRKLWHVKENGNNSFPELHLYLLLTLHLCHCLVFGQQAWSF